jgi:hypothetical protein
MKKLIAIICLTFAMPPLALAVERGAFEETKAPPAVEKSVKDAERWAALSSKWCCRFKSLTNQSRSITLNTNGVVAVSACWSAGLAMFPAIKNVSVSKGAC